MKKYILFLSFCFAFFSCEPEDSPAPPTTPPPTEPVVTPEPEAEPMVVTEVFPAMNDIGDTITIKGKNFTRDLSVLLPNKLVMPLLLNDSVIKFKIPFASYDPADFQLKLKNKNEEKILINPYELYAPVIDSIPGMFAFNDTIVLYGKHLLIFPYQNNNILYLNEQDVPVISHSRDSIVFKLPYQFSEYEYDVLVKAQQQQAKMDAGLKIQPPSVSGFSKTSVEIGEVISIYGSYFYPGRANLHEVHIQGLKAEVVEAYRDSLQVRIPLGPYKSRKIDELKIKLFEKEIIPPVDLDITSTWYMYSFKKDREITGGSASVGTITRWSFKANDAFYFNVFRDNGNYSPINNILYKYTPDTDHWEEIDLPIPSELMEFGEVLEFYPQEGTNNVFIYIQRKTENFFKFNLQTGELVAMKDFPADRVLHYGTGFHLNGNFYYGLGFFQDPDQIINKALWRYEPGADTWTEIDPMPDVDNMNPRFGASVFRKANSVVIANGYEYAYDVWEFSSNETWTRKNDLPNPATDAINVQTGGKGYFFNYLGNDFWEYDIPSDHWTRREDLKLKTYGTGHETMFIHGDYVYFVGYLNNYAPDGAPFLRYDHAILRTELSNFK
ncbi:IPT/TIG domain-containing protein [Salinimicrobium xinjiangense]|uniref:IPT/TIG domain-containing protein n=1 Tax=Salinimicrobium xinjiangense TaxID=438596 RepID=UPI0009FD4EA0|nr:IPT/TIG domain-containing protein [Salinimicrobium xinjiangense]